MKIFFTTILFLIFLFIPQAIYSQDSISFKLSRILENKNKTPQQLLVQLKQNAQQSVRSNSNQKMQLMSEAYSWDNLGGYSNVLRDRVYTVGKLGNDLYAGGVFSGTGNDYNIMGIARWDGSNWHRFPDETPEHKWIIFGDVYSIIVDGTDIYIAGNILVYDELAADPFEDYLVGLVKWDGTTMTGLGGSYHSGGMTGAVYKIIKQNDDLIVGGDFDDAGGNLDADNIALWNGTSWQSYGNVIHDVVYDIAVSDTSVYIAGGFSDIGGNSTFDKIARWDGNQWNPIGPLPNNVSPSSIAAIDNKVYIGGYFRNLWGNPAADNVAYWDGIQWNALGSGTLYGYVAALFVDNNDLYVGGDFYNAGNLSNTVGLARWDGSNWYSVGNLTDPYHNTEIVSIEKIDGDFYMGGWFTDLGGVLNANKLARWDGSNWHSVIEPVGTGLNDIIQKLIVSGKKVYAVGRFTNASGNNLADNFACWDGSQWNNLGLGLNGGSWTYIYDMAIANDNLYVAGSFKDMGGNQAADYLAKWDGQNWSAVGTPFTGSAYFMAVTSSGNDIYVAGRYNNDYKVAKWNGANWTELPGPFGLDGASFWVYDIAVYGTDVYIAGRFTDAGGNPNADYIAKWNGTGWQALGSGLNNYVTKIAVNNGIVYATGIFTNAGGDPNADNLAYFDGTNWHAMGTNSIGTGSAFSVQDFAVQGNNLYAGGYFFSLDGDVKNSHLAKWDGSNWIALNSGVNDNDNNNATGGVSGLGFAGSDLFCGGTFRYSNVNWTSYFNTANGHPSYFFERYFGAYTTEATSVVSKAVESGAGVVSFNNTTNVTGVNISIQGGTNVGNGNFDVFYYEDTPVNISNITDDVLNYRWILQQTGLGQNYNGEVRFDLDLLPDGGSLTNPYLVKVYSRLIPGTGNFTEVPTTYDPINNEIVASVAGFGEFVFVQTTQIGINISIKVFLEGPFSNGIMSTTLLSANYIPLAQPYNINPIYYTGTESVASLPANVTDWILLELRSDLTTFVARKAVFLKNNGTVVDLDGSTDIDFPTLYPGNYYLVIYHRNHLAIMSANTISIGGSAVLYDFTTSNTMAYGTNAMKALTGGVFGLYGGDVNRSGIVNNADRSLIISANLQSGYKSEDANLSGIVSAPDRNFATNNNTKGTLVPALTNTPLKVNNIIKTQAGD